MLGCRRCRRADGLEERLYMSFLCNVEGHTRSIQLDVMFVCLFVFFFASFALIGSAWLDKHHLYWIGNIFWCLCDWIQFCEHVQVHTIQQSCRPICILAKWFWISQTSDARNWKFICFVYKTGHLNLFRLFSSQLWIS